jgi:hypothetical protein
MKTIFFVSLSAIILGCSSGDFSGETRAADAKKPAATTVTNTGAESKDAVAGSPTQGAVQTTSNSPADKTLAKSCNSGEYVSGINADGSIQCSALPATAPSTVTNTTVVHEVAPQPASPSCYMETTAWRGGGFGSIACSEPCSKGGTQSGECTLISSTCMATYKTGTCNQGTGSRMCCK